MSSDDEVETQRLDRRSAGSLVVLASGVVALLVVAVTASAATQSQSTANTFGPRLSGPMAFDTSKAPHVAEAKLTTSGVVAAYAKLPLAFVRGRGPLVGFVGMSAAGPGYRFTFGRHQAMLTLARPDRGLALALRFLSSSASVPVGAVRLPGKVSYVRGSDPRRWRTGLTTYGEVVYRNLWPGVDLTFRGTAGTLKYSFLVRPGADASAIRLAYRGARALSVDEKGNLHVRTAIASLLDGRPVSYQIVAGKQTPVASRFAVRGGTSFGFMLGHYDTRRPLVIDPGLTYSTFLGGAGVDSGTGVAVDASGNAYVSGWTGSTGFPTTAGVFDTGANGGLDAFITKLNPAGSALVYSTYIGGSQDDQALGIAVDGAGAAFATGFTSSADFPTKAALPPPSVASDTDLNGSQDAFVLKLTPSGGLDYSTYLGGDSNDQGLAIAVDARERAYVTGFTDSVTNFPFTPAALDKTANGGFDAFLTNFDQWGTGSGYSSYLGGSGEDRGQGLALDGSGNVYLTGVTLSADFPATAGAFDTSFNGGAGDAFVTKFAFVDSGNDGDVYTTAYSTFLGGDAEDRGSGVALGAAGAVYVTGRTAGTFPTTAGAFDTSFNGSFDAFATKLDPTGSSLAYSTYLGGSGDDQGLAIAPDSGGRSTVVGRTGSTNFPTTTGAFDTTANGGDDAYVTKLAASGTSLTYSTYLGGSSTDRGQAVAVDVSGTYVAGFANSGDFPTTPGAFDTTQNSDSDAFVTKLDLVGDPFALALTPTPATNEVDATHCVTATVTDFGGQPVPGVTVRFSVSQAVATQATPSSGSSTTDANGQAQFCYTARLPGQNVIHAFADTNGNTTQDTGEPSADGNKTWTLPPSTACDVSLDGSIVTAGGDKATFGGSAKLKGTSVQGNQQYDDKGPAQPRKVKSIEQTAINCSADRRSARIFGTARIDGSGTFVFRIDVTDAGEPGTSDSYGIRLSDGYFSGQPPLSGGNIQIR